MKHKIFLLSIFTIAMAYLESAVVVYLRELYYPGGFSFPIVPAAMSVALIEIGREAATIVMLFTASALAYPQALNRFSAFMFAFGVWDIFYYIWLYVFLGWPPSLLTWDILFLIPIPWIGPVIAPVIVSVSLITAGALMLRLDHLGIKFEPSIIEWGLVITAGLIIILSFIWDYRIVVEGTIPHNFKWGVFTAGEIIGIGVFINSYLKSVKKSKNQLMI